MVFRKRKRSFKKRPFRKRKRFSRKRRITRFRRNSLSVIPRKVFKKLNYSTTLSLNATAVSADSYAFSCNNLFDSNFSGVGHQALGFDQLCGATGLYDHAVVVGAKLTATFLTNGSGSSSAARVMIFIRDIGTLTTFNPDTVAEQPGTMHRVISPLTSNNRTTMVYKVNPNKWLGKSSPLSSKELKNSAVAGPTEQCFFHIYVSGIGSNDPGNVDVVVKLEYLAAFIEPKMLSGS